MALFGVAYALRMGIVVTAVSLSVALARGSVVSALHRAGRLIGRLGGLLLLLAGVYVAYYGWYEIRVLRGADVDDPVIAAGATIQRWLASGLDRIGVAGTAAGVAALLGIAIAVQHSRRTRRST
jgi:cytochrome c-type biogenesis protein